MGPFHPAVDPGHRLGTPGRPVVAAAIVLGFLDMVDLDVAELAVEEAVVGGATEFSVGGEPEAEPLLQGDGVADRGVLGNLQLGCRDTASRMAATQVQKRGRAEQAADMLGAEGRLGHGVSSWFVFRSGRRRAGQAEGFVMGQRPGT